MIAHAPLNAEMRVGTHSRNGPFRGCTAPSFFRSRRFIFRSRTSVLPDKIVFTKALTFVSGTQKRILTRTRTRYR